MFIQPGFASRDPGAAMVQYISPMRIFCVVSLCVLIYHVSAATQKEQEEKGLCKGRGCKTKAQTGLDGYCKKCYGKFFPEAYAEFRKGRKKQCRVCEEDKELIGGICKPCRRARQCDGCDKINTDLNAAYCERERCRTRREQSIRSDNVSYLPVHDCRSKIWLISLICSIDFPPCSTC